MTVTRIRTLAGAAVLAVVVVGLLIWSIPGGDDTTVPGRPAGEAQGTPTPTPTPTSSPSDAPITIPTDPGPTDGADDPPSPSATVGDADGSREELLGLVGEIESGANHLPPAKPGEIVEVENAVTVVLDSVERVNAQATGRGEISGPALAVTLTVTNTGDGALTLANTVVNLYGDAGVPGSQFADDARSDPFTGSVEPGARATATYVVSLPPTRDGSVIITASVEPGAPTPLFVATLSEDF